MHRGVRLTVAALLATTVSVGTAAAAPDEHHLDPSDATAPPPVELQWDRADTWLADLAGGGRGLAPTEFVGTDGNVYSTAGPRVDGLDGTVYFGEEMNSACAFGGPRFARALERLSKVADVIEASGRQVVFSVAPNKSAVNKQSLPEQLPHGACDADGIAAQDRVMDTFRDERYVQVRERLEAQSRRDVAVYWQLDNHWTSVAASHYARSVAEELDPRLARRQTFAPIQETITVEMYFLGGTGTVEETGPGRASTTPVTVRPPAGGQLPTAGSPVVPDVSWVTGPRRRTWRGSTLLVGDSFTYRALPTLMPLFRRGSFFWTTPGAEDLLIREISRHRTVVIEVVQRYLPISPLVTKSFRRDLGKALGSR
jgi:alginate O-acetyltransferase complex protein AlgJ